jgi:hypothetical protein
MIAEEILFPKGELLKFVVKLHTVQDPRSPFQVNSFFLLLDVQTNGPKPSTWASTSTVYKSSFSNKDIKFFRFIKILIDEKICWVSCFASDFEVIA